MDVTFDTIFGVGLGFEYVPRQTFEVMGVEEVKCSFILDLFCVRFVFTFYEDEE
jgi:hypothetical protein